MSRFTPLDLHPYWNASRAPDGWHPAIAPHLATLPAGDRSFWGIPFCLAPASQGNVSSWLLLEQPGRDVTVNLPPGTRATYLVFAHFCDESHDPAGLRQPADYDPGLVTRPGEELAHYVVAYAEGGEVSQPIRRRFEVNETLVRWGQLAFAARPHAQNVPLPWQGPYDVAAWGRAQTGVSSEPWGGPLQLWLYALPNPQPEREIALLRLESCGAGRVAVAGITLYHGASHPLQRRRLESLRVALPEPIAVAAVDTSIDLGTIVRRYAVPAFEPEAWLAAQPQGWGEEAAAPAPTAQMLLDVTASPDATLHVAGSVVELEGIYTGGRAQSGDGRVHVELLTPRTTWLHGRVLDATTGRPTAARIHFRAPDGRYLPPYGHRQEVNYDWFEDYGADLKLGSTEYAYVDGQFQVELPAGEVYVEIAKGFEYQPVRRRLEIRPGQRELDLTLERPLDWRRTGWVTADTHVHFLSPQTAHLEAQAEGVNLVNLLASQWGDLFTNVGDLSDGPSGSSTKDTIIWVGTENRQHLLGHISLLGGKGRPVFPMTTGGADESAIGDPTVSSLADWADRCREREGLVVIPHFPNPYCEVAADIVLGKVDAAEIRYFTPALDSFNVREWYRFLNCGYRIAAVGGTDKMWAGMPVGGVRTYAHLGDVEFTFANWAAAVRAGRTFTTSGPLLGLSVEGQAPGAELRLPEGGGTVTVDAWAESVQQFHELQIVVNGQVVASQPAGQGTLRARLSTPLKLSGSAWIAARCISRYQVWHGWPINIAAHTSPVYVRCGEQELFNPSDATFMLTLIDGGLTWLDTLSIPADAERQARIRGVFEAARASLHARLHAHGSPHAHP